MSSYLRTNWGAPFVALFVILLLASAAEVALGSDSQANNIALYAFYSLVAGVVLQIVSYIKYGDRESRVQSEIDRTAAPRPRGGFLHWRISRIIIAVIIVAIIIGAGVISFYYSSKIVNNGNTSTVGSKLSTSLGFDTSIAEPNGSVIVSFGISSLGGKPPYSFTAKWSDGFSQTNGVGLFSRLFQQNQQLPSSVTVQVKSEDNEAASIVVEIHGPGASFTATRSTLESFTSSGPLASVEFVESGLANGTYWSAMLDGMAKNSTNNSIQFTLLPGSYNYTVSYPYPSNFSTVYVPSPKSGVVVLNKTSSEVKIAYTLVRVTIPTESIYTIQGQPVLARTNGNYQINLTYSNNFVTQIPAVVLAYITNSSSGLLLALRSDAIIASGGGSASASIPLVLLKAGNYSADIFVQSLGEGIQLSEKTNTTFTIPSS